MTTYEKIEAFIAIYAAILSTCLFINTISENRKKLKVILEYVSFYEAMRIILINNSKRPITIENVSMTLNGESIPKNCLIDSGGKFPLKINGFDSSTINLQDIIAETYNNSFTKNITITVTDIDNHKFTKFSYRNFNPKY